MIDWMQRRSKHSPMLQDILRVIKQDPQQDLQLVPVSVFWGRPLARQKHWIQVLFADTWAVGGRTRRFFTILFHGRNTRLVFSQPLSLRELVNAVGSDEAAVQNHLLGLLNQQREATFGPRIQSRKQMAEAVVRKTSITFLLEPITYCCFFKNFRRNPHGGGDELKIFLRNFSVKFPKRIQTTQSRFRVHYRQRRFYGHQSSSDPRCRPN